MDSATELRRICYVSNAVHEFSEADLDRLLQGARRRNEAAGVTGVLMYHDGAFFQMLEGEAAAVAGVFARIRMDPRHTQCIQLTNTAITRRAFSGWSMGFVRRGGAPQALPAWIDLSELRSEEARLKLTAAPDVRMMLDRFLDSFRELELD